MTTYFLLAVCLAVPAAGRAAGAPEVERAPGLAEPDYKAFVLNTLDGWLAQRAFAEAAGLVARGNFHPVAEAAACQVRAWEWTGEARYADGATGLLKVLFAFRARGQEDFFVIYPLMYSYATLDVRGRLDPELKQGFRRFAVRNFTARDIALHNQTLQRAAGLALAARSLADLPQAGAWRTYAETIWGLLLGGGDVTENAPNYNQIDLLYVFLLADVLGKAESLHDARIEKMYRRFRDQVSPAGVVPAYGDSGNGADDPAWPIRHGWASWPPAFERAATFYRDPTFRWAALKLFHTGAAREPLRSPFTQAGDLFRLSFAADRQERNLAPETPRAGSAVLVRTEPGGADARDKLILAPSRHDGAPFLLGDLYARGDHAHINQPGAIDYYEFAGAPLLFMLGYNNRAPAETNLVLVKSSAEGFPHAVPPFTPQRWNEAVLPTSRLAAVPGKPDQRHLTEFALRVAAGRRGVTFWFDGMRLEGPAGSRLIDSTETAAGWSQTPILDPELPKGAHLLRWEIKPGVAVLTRRGLDVTLDCRAFTQIRFFWKLSNNDEEARPLIFRAPGASDQHCHALQLDPTLLDARVSSHDQDQLGSLQYRGWFSDGAELTRKIVLTREGLLIVRDELLPDAAAAGRVAGPIWHLAPTAEPERGDNWFNAAGGRLELLAWFSPRTAQTIGVQSVDVWQRKGQKTVFARQTLVAGQTVVFVTVLVPHESGIKARPLAKAIAVLEEAGATIVRVTSPPAQGKLSVTIGKDDAWRVERGE